MADVLPDSRLQNHDWGNVVADWQVENPDGTLKTIRLTLQPIFCFSCGRSNGYVPKDAVSYVSWLCQPCSEKWGQDASLHVSSDREFWDAVGEEMRIRFGKVLTQRELEVLADQGNLGRGLELLERESPYKGM